MHLWSRAGSARNGAALGFAFGVGLYAAGTWWLYISIHGFGQAPFLVAALVMGSLVLIMAAYQALLGYLVCRWLRPGTPAGNLLWVPAAWVLVEWWRGWFLSGFPWLSLGYSQTDTWLAGLAPVGGVHLVSYALLVGAGAVLVLWQGRAAMRAVALVAVILPWTLGQWLTGVAWTRAAGPPVSVAVVQGAIPQDMKWLDTPANQQNILDTYWRLHRQALGAQLIVWPEAALPGVANDYAGYIGRLWSASRAAGSDIVIGTQRAELVGSSQNAHFYNSILALGHGEPAFYDKRHLVPFAEYFPVPHFVRTWLRLMSLPNSDFDRGARHQPALQLAGIELAPSICYEDAYPSLLRREIRASGALVTVTNDAWFGHSSARYQHLQIARMLALESRRFLVRAANDGVSAVIDADGRVIAQAREWVPTVLKARLVPRRGDTPYLVVGDALVVALASLLMAGRLLQGRVRVKDSS
jgi:apolipoprotein N-acyltransferase